MTDEEWQTCDYPHAMLEALSEEPHGDKFRRLACQWCLSPEVRRLLETQRARKFLASADQYLAGQISWAELLDAVRDAPRSFVSRGYGGRKPVRVPPAAQALRAVEALSAPDAWDAAWKVAQEAVNFLGPSACDQIRELFEKP